MDWIVLFGLGSLQILLAWAVMCRIRSESRNLRRLHLALAIHLVGEPLRRDPEFVRILDRCRRAPRELSREDRVRARSWIRSATRIYGLTLEEPDGISGAAWGVPSMGENRREENLPDVPTIEDLIDLDPEFLSFLDALRSA
jgi:hypothetical protein